MKITFIVLAVSLLATQSFARDTKCDLGFQMTKHGSYAESYTQAKGLFAEVTRILHEKGYNLKILEAKSTEKQLNLDYSPNSKEGTGVCSALISGNSLTVGEAIVVNSYEQPKSYRPTIDPIFDVCWDLIRDKLKDESVLPTCKSEE